MSDDKRVSISDEAVEAAYDALTDCDPGLAGLFRSKWIRAALEAAAPHLMAELAESRDGELFRFTWAQREWMRSAGVGE